MKRALQGAGIVALLAFAWAVCVVALSVRSVARSVNQIDRSVAVVAKSTNDILTSVRQQVDRYKESSEAEATYWRTVKGRTDTVLANAAQTVKDLDAMVIKTDTNVNANLLPEATATLKTTAESITTLSTDSHRTLTASGETMESLAKLVADPNIPQTLATANASMREWNETMHNVQETSKEARAWAHKAMTPVSLARRAVVFTWNSMLQFLGAYARAGT